MKYKLLIVFICILCLCGCGNKSKKTEDKIEEKKEQPVVDEKYTKSFLVLNFYYNKNAGLDWEYTIKNDNVKIEKKDTNMCLSDGTDCRGTYDYYVFGNKEGKTTITFTQIKNENKKDIKKAIYEVEVDKDLNVKILNQKGNYFEK